MRRERCDCSSVARCPRVSVCQCEREEAAIWGPLTLLSYRVGRGHGQAHTGRVLCARPLAQQPRQVLPAQDLEEQQAEGLGAPGLQKCARRWARLPPHPRTWGAAGSRNPCRARPQWCRWGGKETSCLFFLISLSHNMSPSTMKEPGWDQSK